MHFAKLVWLRGKRALSLILAASLVTATAGCSLFGSADPQGSRAWSNALGQGLRGTPPSTKTVPNADAKEPAKKVPLLEKFRDKRVGQINEHLSVEEPAGW